jgi:hypothetical protein
MRPLLRCAALVLLLAPTHALAEDDPALPSVYLDAVGTYGIGGQSALGAELHATAAWTFARGDVDGTLDLGLRLGYENEPVWLAPWIDARDVDAVVHRVRAHLTVGPTLRFGGAARELSLGLHLYGGPTSWESQASVRHAAYGVDGTAQVSRLAADFGALLRFTWRPDPAIGLALIAGAPIWGLHSSYVVDLFHVGLGLAFRLR